MTGVADLDPAAAPAPTEQPADQPPPREEAARPKRPLLAELDVLLRATGFAVGLGLAALSALYEAFMTPLYLGQVRFPVAVFAAVVGNLALVWFTVVVTGRRLLALGPAVVWVAVMVTASGRTTEGDLVMTNSNWVGIGTMIAGAVAFGAAGYWLVLRGSMMASGPKRR